MQTENVSEFCPNKTAKRFSDFAKPAGFDGTKVKVDDILNKEIGVIAFKVKESKYPKGGADACTTVQFTIPDTPDDKYIFFTGSSVLREQLEEYKEELPFLTVIKKIDRYYTFT